MVLTTWLIVVTLLFCSITCILFLVLREAETQTPTTDTTSNQPPTQTSTTTHVMDWGRFLMHPEKYIYSAPVDMWKDNLHFQALALDSVVHWKISVQCFLYLLKHASLTCLHWCRLLDHLAEPLEKTHLIQFLVYVQEKPSSSSVQKDLFVQEFWKRIWNSTPDRMEPIQIQDMTVDEICSLTLIHHHSGLAPTTLFWCVKTLVTYKIKQQTTSIGFDWKCWMRLLTVIQNFDICWFLLHQAQPTSYQFTWQEQEQLLHLFHLPEEKTLLLQFFIHSYYTTLVSMPVPLPLPAPTPPTLNLALSSSSSSSLSLPNLNTISVVGMIEMQENEEEEDKDEDDDDESERDMEDQGEIVQDFEVEEQEEAEDEDDVQLAVGMIQSIQSLENEPRRRHVQDFHHSTLAQILEQQSQDYEQTSQGVWIPKNQKCSEVKESGNGDGIVTCTVCEEREANATMKPCGHSRICLKCAIRQCKEDGRCMYCRAEIRMIDRVIL